MESVDPYAEPVIRQQMRDRSPSVEVRHLLGTQAGCRSLNAWICRLRMMLSSLVS